MADKNFKKYSGKLIVEGVLKSVFCGLIAGFGVAFVAGFVSWMVDYDYGVMLTAILGGSVALVAGLVMYFVQFRPTPKKVARRVDKLGLEERYITMLELENDDSYIAQRQRADALVHIEKTSKKDLKISFSKVMITLVSVLAVVGVGMTTLAGLAAMNVIKSGMELLRGKEIVTEPDRIEVHYTIKKNQGGSILGNADQYVLPGEDAEEVVAVADDGYMFVGWDDGSSDPSREDKEITSEVTYTAVFTAVKSVDGDVDDEYRVPLPDDSSKEGDGSGRGEGNRRGKGQGNGNGQGQGDGAGGGQTEDYNQVIDGSTYYGDVIDDSYEEDMNGEDSNEMDSEERDFVEGYGNGLIK